MFRSSATDPPVVSSYPDLDKNQPQLTKAKSENDKNPYQRARLLNFKKKYNKNSLINDENQLTSMTRLSSINHLIREPFNDDHTIMANQTQPRCVRNIAK